MEKNEKRMLLNRLSAARSGLLQTAPFYGTLLMHLGFGLADCGTACTDMKRILWDPEFLRRISDPEVKFVLLHEVMHCVLDHVGRGSGKIHLIYNIAADIVVNSNILEVWQQKEFFVDGEKVMHLAPNGKEGRLYTADEVYKMLLDKYREQTKDAEELSGTLRADFGDGTDNHEIWDAIQINENERNEWRQIVLESARGEEAGAGPSAGVRKLLGDEISSHVIDWRQVLHEFIQISADTFDFTFCPADRRFSDGDFILPAFSEQDGERIENIWLLVDASGSIDDETLTKIFAEVRYSLSQFTSMRAKISSFDMHVSEPMEFENEEDLAKLRIVGGGGTSFHCIFDYLSANMRDDLPAAIVILTDGYASWPEESASLGVPVLWILTEDGKDAPWGKSVHVEL